MNIRLKYPIFVEETAVRMIWIEADSPQDAAKQLTECPSDYDYRLKGSDPVDGWITGYAPSDTGRYHWDAVYGYTGAADEPDMHVALNKIHLAEQARAAHGALGHPGLTDLALGGKQWCPTCRRWVEAARPEQAGGTPNV